jgi:hypothetical protein
MVASTGDDEPAPALPDVEVTIRAVVDHDTLAVFRDMIRAEVARELDARQAPPPHPDDDAFDWSY